MADAPWWLSVVSGAVGAVAGFGFAVKMAKYQASLSRHRTEQQAAMTLRVDLTRLDDYLSPRAERFGATFDGQHIVAPTFHRWAEPSISQLAGADPTIVGECMTLDVQLENFAAGVRLLHHRLHQHDDANEVLKHETSEFLSDGDHDGWLVQRGKYERRVRNAEESCAEAMADVREVHARAKATIAVLLSRVSAIADRPEPEFIELEEERRARELTAETRRAR